MELHVKRKYCKESGVKRRDSLLQLFNCFKTRSSSIEKNAVEYTRELGLHARIESLFFFALLKEKSSGKEK